MADDPEKAPEEEGASCSNGDLVVSLECPEGRVSIAVPNGSDPQLVGRLLDMAVKAIGHLKTQMQ